MKIQYLFLILAATVISATAMTREAHELLAAYHSNDLEQLDAVVSRGISIDTPLAVDGTTVLMRAAKDGNEKILQWALKAGAYINIRDFSDNSPVHVTAYRGHPDCLQILLDNGADPNIQSKYIGTAPLHAAASSGHVNCLQILLDAGADLNIQATGGPTSLHGAALTGRADCVSLLRAFGADPYQTDNFGEDAFKYAGQSTNSSEICARLQETVQQARERIQPLLYNAALKATRKKTLYSFVKDRELGLKRHTIKRSLS